MITEISVHSMEQSFVKIAVLLLESFAVVTRSVELHFVFAVLLHEGSNE